MVTQALLDGFTYPISLGTFLYPPLSLRNYNFTFSTSLSLQTTLGYGATMSGR